MQEGYKVKKSIDDKLRLGMRMYTWEATFEYLLSTLVAGSYLATLTKALNMSDSLTAILSSVISLGCLFQLLSLFIRPKKAKGLVIALSVLNQLFFMLLYVTPIVPLSGRAKTAIFVALIFSAYLLYNLAHPKKINWLMSLVDDKKRGTFTANKEIVSLLSGMVFSFCMGSVIDHFKEKGEMKAAFLVSAAVIFALMALHTLTMVFAIERETKLRSADNLKSAFMGLVRNKKVLAVTAVFVLYRISEHVARPFYGTYLIGELGFSLKFTSVATMIGSLSRIAVSKFLGRYADKNSFAQMIEKCFISLGVAQMWMIYATPATGKVMYILYHVFHGIALGGINSALINLVFDYVLVENRADSLAITQSAAGLTGFLTTLCASPLVVQIQKNGNSFLGISVYAQQVVTVIALLMTVLAILYIRFVFINKARQKEAA